MAISEKNNNMAEAQDDSLQLKDLLALCIGKWKWFVLSLIICVGAAFAYLLTTPPVFTRSTSILIKEERKGRSAISSEMNAFSELGLFNANTNVDNEVVTMQSPDLLLEVIRRLSLDVDYKADGRFHKRTLYGRTLPLKVSFKDLAYNDFSSLTITIHKDGTLTLSDFKLNGKEVGKGTEVAAQQYKEVYTPVGLLTVTPTPYYKGNALAEMKIYVSRKGLISAISSCKAKMTADRNSKTSTIIDITYKDVNIQRAEDYLNTLISVYNENWVKDKNQIAVSTSQFINERLQVIENELGNVDSDISSYKSENQITDMQAASSMYMNTANQANMQVTELNNQLYMARYIRDHVSDKNSKDQLLPANSGINSPVIEQQINEYNDKMLQRNSLVANSSAENPLVADMDQNLNEMRNSIISSIDNQVSTLNTQIQGLRGIQGLSTSRLLSNPKQAEYLLSVERQQKVKEALYLFLLQKREENELSQAFTAYNTRVITSPTGSMAPVSPNRRMILLAAMLLGILIPIAIIYLRENLNTKVRGRKDIEDLTIPFVGEIPQYDRKKRKKKKGDGQASKIVVKPESRNVINEAFRVVRTNMEFMTGADHVNKVIMVTSANPGSGKTFLTMNIATSFAIKEKKVIAIDLDMRRASLSEFINKPKLGISDYLNGRVADWHAVKYDLENYSNIEMIPVGTIPPNPAELLFSDRLQKLLDELREQYDLIFLDCPPVEIVADASVIAKYADMTLFVIRAGLMEREMLPVIEGYYKDQKFRNMSVLLNGTTAAGSRYGYHRYGYRYGYAYGYGNKGYGGYTEE